MKRVQHIIRSLAAVVILSAMGVGSVYAVEQARNNDAQPIHIEADRMESFERQSEVLFTGQVEATQGDIVLHADEMKVNYLSSEGGDQKGNQQARKVDKLFARGNVKVVSAAGWVATGKTMDYFAVDRKAILIGDAKVWQDNNLVTGNRIVLYLDEGKSVVESDPQQGRQRVKAFLYPGGENEKKSDK
ncbi:MAG: lipopolysaccharide transport periplasmic protein LptA [Desulfobulbaceae bacterium]|nr:lipopolysaccharide transport periplasmic protein LptA [Desulfobulbaceae bacterium]